MLLGCCNAGVLREAVGLLVCMLRRVLGGWFAAELRSYAGVLRKAVR